MSTSPITVFVADDHAPVVELVRRLLAEMDGFEFIGSAADGTEALRQFEEMQPQVAVIDQELPGLSGSELTRELVARELPIAVVLYTAGERLDINPESAFADGAKAIVYKTSPVEQLTQAIAAVAAGNRYCDALAAGRKFGSSPAPLTQREREVLQLLSLGKRTADIANSFGTSPETVRTQAQTARAKLGVSSLYHAIGVGLREGYIS